MIQTTEKESDLQMEYVFNPETGNLEERLVIRNPSQFEVLSKEEKEKRMQHAKKEFERRTDKRGPFVMGKNEPMRNLEDSEITVSDRRYFMELIIYTQFDGEPLKKDEEYLTNKSIASLWGINEYNTSRKLTKFTQLGLLSKKKHGNHNVYIVNDLYFSKGSMRKDEKFVKLFQNKLKEIVESVQKIENLKNRNRKVPVKIGDVIGLLHAMLPYFHYETYYLVKNPDERITLEGETVLDALERNPKSLKHLPKSQIGRILGHKNADRPTIDKYFHILQQAGAVMVLTTKGKTRYLIHPDLMFRLDSNGQDVYTRHVRAQFGQHDSD